MARAYWMIAVAVLVAWAALVVGIVVDIVSFDSASGSEELWRFRLSNLANVVNPGFIAWVAVAAVLAAAHAGRRLMMAFAVVGALGTLLGLAEIWNVATSEGRAFGEGSEGVRIGLQTGGVALTVTMLAIVRNRLAASAEEEFAVAGAEAEVPVVEMDYPLSSPEENR